MNILFVKKDHIPVYFWEQLYHVQLWDDQTKKQFEKQLAKYTQLIKITFCKASQSVHRNKATAKKLK